MPVYLVERYVADAANLTGAAARLAELARDAERRDRRVRRVRLLWSARVPADETWFGWFEAPDAAVVADLHRRAAFPFDRISPAELLAPLPHVPVTQEDNP